MLITMILFKVPICASSFLICTNISLNTLKSNPGFSKFYSISKKSLTFQLLFYCLEFRQVTHCILNQIKNLFNSSYSETIALTFGTIFPKKWINFLLYVTISRSTQHHHKIQASCLLDSQEGWLWLDFTFQLITLGVVAVAIFFSYLGVP